MLLQLFSLLMPQDVSFFFFFFLIISLILNDWISEKC
jgi:hypothetical protein